MSLANISVVEKSLIYTSLEILIGDQSYFISEDIVMSALLKELGLDTAFFGVLGEGHPRPKVVNPNTNLSFSSPVCYLRRKAKHMYRAIYHSPPKEVLKIIAKFKV